MKKWVIILAVIIPMEFIIPGQPTIPVAGTSEHDWNPRTFRFEPWGLREHIRTSTYSPKIADQWWQGDYRIRPLFSNPLFRPFTGVCPGRRLVYKAGDEMCKVGVTGNAIGKPAHLHYSITSLLPLPWRMDFSTQGYKTMFYLDPGEYLTTLK